LQAYTEIYSESESTPHLSEDIIPIKPPPKPERSEPTSPKSPAMNVRLHLINPQRLFYI
jgi:hypothetical protein